MLLLKIVSLNAPVDFFIESNTEFATNSAKLNAKIYFFICFIGYSKTDRFSLILHYFGSYYRYRRYAGALREANSLNKLLIVH